MTAFFGFFSSFFLPLLFQIGCVMRGISRDCHRVFIGVGYATCVAMHEHWPRHRPLGYKANNCSLGRRADKTGDTQRINILFRLDFILILPFRTVVGWSRIFLLLVYEGFRHDLGSVTELTCSERETGSYCLLPSFLLSLREI